MYIKTPTINQFLKFITKKNYEKYVWYDKISRLIGVY